MLRAVRPAVFALILAACGSSSSTPDAGPDAIDPACRFRTAADDVTPAPISTPRWAFRPWISKDISTDADTRAFVAGFRDRGIPVGAVVLDSPWETDYNTFVPDPARYPAFDRLVADLHADGIRLVLWTTSLINQSSLDLEEGGSTYPGPSPNYQVGADCGFYINEGESYLWWKGLGSALDFSDREAVGWWHRQQDALLDLGIDGWKLDFGEDYIDQVPIATDDGEVSLQTYSEAYYRDFYEYGRARRGANFVTMVRPYDKSYAFPGRFYARPEHAPVAWVGDNRRDFVGLVDALDHVFRSARAGYAMVGSDVGGYLDRDDQDFNVFLPFDTLVFARWTAASALMPFMQLHGRANIAPWTVPDHVDETVAMYRFWATLHDEMVPFFYSLTAAQHAGGAPVLRPIGDAIESWTGDWRWQVGDALLVAPILDASGSRDVALPDGIWYDWWDGARQAGGVAVRIEAMPRDRIPLYAREGAIVPLEVTSAVTGLGTLNSAGALTVLVWPAPTETSFDVRDDDGSLTTIRAARAKDTQIALSRTPRATILRVRMDAAPSAVTVDGTPAAALASPAAVTASEVDGHAFADGYLWVMVTAGPGAATVVAR
jgi:alpha-glucosidase (family GH31 glycosyl hydrolase)